MASFSAPAGMSLAAQQMVAEGPIARRVADVRAALEILAGPDIRDPRSVPARLTQLGRDELVRVAVLAEPPGGPTHPGIASSVRSAAELLSRVGHDVVEIVPPLYEEVLDYWGRLLVNDIIVQRSRLDAVIGDDGKRILDDFEAGNPAPTLESMATLHSLRFTAMQMWSEFFSTHAVLLSPTWAQPAFAHGDDIDHSEELRHSTLRPVHPANFLGIPAVVVPHGGADGLPVGVQVMGDRFTDLRCLDIAAQIEASTPQSTPIDPVR